MAGWIKMPFGTEVGIGPGHIVLDGDPAPPKRRTALQFSARAYCGEMVAQLLLSTCILTRSLVAQVARDDTMVNIILMHCVMIPHWNFTRALASENYSV